MTTQTIEKPLIIDYPVVPPVVLPDPLYPTADEIVELFKKYNVLPRPGRLITTTRWEDAPVHVTYACALGVIALEKGLVKITDSRTGLEHQRWQEVGINPIWATGVMTGFDYEPEVFTEYFERGKPFFSSPYKAGLLIGREVRMRTLEA